MSIFQPPINQHFQQIHYFLLKQEKLVISKKRNEKNISFIKLFSKTPFMTSINVLDER